MADKTELSSKLEQKFGPKIRDALMREVDMMTSAAKECRLIGPGGVLNTFALIQSRIDDLEQFEEVGKDSVLLAVQNHLDEVLQQEFRQSCGCKFYKMH